MLDSIRRRMGDTAFASAAREFFQSYTGKSIGTEEFRRFWKQKLGDRSTLIDAWLESGGGLPEVEKFTAHN